jgi:hypothetical protein
MILPNSCSKMNAYVDIVGFLDSAFLFVTTSNLNTRLDGLKTVVQLPQPHGVFLSDLVTRCLLNAAIQLEILRVQLASESLGRSTCLFPCDRQQGCRRSNPSLQGRSEVRR